MQIHCYWCTIIVLQPIVLNINFYICGNVSSFQGNALWIMKKTCCLVKRHFAIKRDISFGMKRINPMQAWKTYFWLVGCRLKSMILLAKPGQDTWMRYIFNPSTISPEQGYNSCMQLSVNVCSCVILLPSVCDPQQDHSPIKVNVRGQRRSVTLVFLQQPQTTYISFQVFTLATANISIYSSQCRVNNILGSHVSHARRRCPRLCVGADE